MEDDLKEYLHFLTIERGLSKNTIESYRRDLVHYLDYLNEHQIASWNELDRYFVLSFCNSLKMKRKLQVRLFGWFLVCENSINF